MKLRIIGSAKLEDGCIRLQLPRRGGDNWYRTTAGVSIWDTQQNEPVTTVLFEPFLERSHNSFWLFRGYLVVVDDTERTLQPEELKVHVKHFIFRKEDKSSKMRKEVERFERFEKLQPICREQIPEDIRMYVWRRDNGKCVQCGSNRHLEFDHVIPVSQGGSRTERNLQLLCTECNKKKSNKI
jgi:hypothetical protein